MYLLLCGVAAYLRNITLRPSLLKDWISFLINYFSYKFIIVLIFKFIFNYELNYIDQIIKYAFTFLFYLLF